MSYSVNEAAKLVGKNPRKIKLDIRQGKLEASRVGDKPNSAYRIEYKDLRKSYSTSFETQTPDMVDAQLASSKDLVATKTVVSSEPTAASQSAEIRVEKSSKTAEKVAQEDDEMQIMRSALAREIRNTRVMQKQLTDATKLIERLLSGQVARSKSTMAPLTLEAHMRPDAPTSATAPDGDKAEDTISMASSNKVLDETATACDNMAVDAAVSVEGSKEFSGGDHGKDPEVDHVPVLAPMLIKDEAPVSENNEAPVSENNEETRSQAENDKSKKMKSEAVLETQQEQETKDAAKTKASVKAPDKNVNEEDAIEDAVPVNEVLKSYQSRLDASLDMLRNLRP